jgi:hypothetical protein
MSTRKFRTAAFAVIVGLSVATPALRANADIVTPVPGGAGSCSSSSNDGQGGTGGTENKICQGGGLVFVGPAVGQVATVVGPTIIGPSQVGTVVVSRGYVVAG